MREMKDSGVEWIGEIPKDWGICKLKNVAKIQTGNTPTKTEQDIFYSSTEGIPWIKAEDLGSNEPIINTKEFLTEEGGKYGRIFPENTVYVCCIASIGKTGFSQMKCSCNQQINGISFINMYWKFGYYVTLAQEMEYILYASGNVMKIINTEKQSNLRCPLPIVNEQKRIADYLDTKCSKIDTIIEKQKAIIEKLKEYKISVITEAVTKGINSEVEMKYSGSVWFGDIPKNWKMKRLKYIFHIQKDIAGEEGHTVLSITQRGIVPKDFSNNDGQFANSYANYQLVHVGDFAMNHMDLVTGWVDISKYEGVTSPDYRVFVLDDTEKNYPEYYLYLMQMCYNARIFYGLGQGVSSMGRWRLQADKFLNFWISVPPSSEQKAIAEYIDKKIVEIESSIEKRVKLIEKLEEYKKSLIYEVVTGKKEV